MLHDPRGTPDNALKTILNTHAEWECWWMTCLTLWNGDKEEEEEISKLGVEEWGSDPDEITGWIDWSPRMNVAMEECS